MRWTDSKRVSPARHLQTQSRRRCGLRLDVALREAGRAERLDDARWVADDRGAVERVPCVRLAGALDRVDEDRWLERVDDRGAVERC